MHIDKIHRFRDALMILLVFDEMMKAIFEILNRNVPRISYESYTLRKQKHRNILRIIYSRDIARTGLTGHV